MPFLLLLLKVLRITEYNSHATLHMCAKRFRVTALIVKTLADIHEYVPLESGVLTNTINWLINNCQNDDGSFSEKSQTIPLKLMVCKKKKKCL